MENNTTNCIGVMSGTSLDGVDLVYVSFNKTNSYSFKIIASQTISYSKKWLKLLKEAFYFSDKELKKIDLTYGKFLAEIILDFIQKNNIKDIDFIASHGHTIHHKPNEGYTLQIGNGEIIARKTNIKTICDFRSQDINFGGQGAPLVPIGDQLLFSDYQYCVNLGGFSNISYNKDNQRIAFDICAVNTVLNHYANKLGFNYDDKGTIAKSGELNLSLLNDLNKLPFYKLKHPKSLGIEYVNDVLLPLIDKHQLPETAILRTFIEHTAFQITIQFKEKGNVLITGGGVFNSFLIDRIKHFTNNKIIIPNTEIIDFKEALIFAFLGLLKTENNINCLKSVTGAKKDHSSGIVFLP